jgi:hypothetical protein
MIKMGHHKHKHKKDPKMTTLESMEALFSAQEPPIESDYKKPAKAGKGWLFYQQVKNSLNEWWEEFNGSLDHHGRLKYTTAREFVKHKVNGQVNQNLLYKMIGPVAKREEGCEVPWLGDWEKRRRHGFGVLDNPDKIKPLLKVIQNNINAAESIRSLTPVLVEELVQYNQLQRQVHEAFAGQAFVRGKASDDKKNMSRFNAYKAMLWALSELKIRIVHEIMRCHGVDPNLPQQMRDMAQIAGGIGAAAALTGIAASQSGRLGPVSGVVSSDGTMIAPYTYDALKLAEHLTRHAHTFKKPGPWEKVIDAEEVEEPKKNGHARPQ